MRILSCLTLLLVAVVGMADAAEGAYARAASYQYGQSRKDLTEIEGEIRQTSVADYPAVEKKLLETLKTPEATVEAKRFLLRMLSIVGSKECVPGVTPFLTDEQLTHEARMVLEPLGDPSAAAALREALGKAKGKVQTGLVSSLGVRRDEQAIAVLVPLVGAEPMVAEAAVRSLGQIGTLEAAKALEGAAGKAPEALKRSVTEARIICAYALAKAGKKAEAAAIFKPLMADAQPDAVRVASLLGLIGSLPSAEAAKTIGEMLQGDDDSMKQATLTAFLTSTDPGLQAAVTEQLLTFKPAAQQALLALLADMPKANVPDGVVKLVKDSPDEAVRIAALKCLVVHGQLADCAMLLALSGKGEAADHKAAFGTLEQMSAEGVNEELGRLLEKAGGVERGRVLGLLAKRRATGALPSILKLAQGADAEAALEAVKAVETLGGAAELAPLMDLLEKAGDEKLRAATEKATDAICLRTEDKAACEKAILPALAKVKGAARVAVLRLLPRVRTAAALEALGQAVKDADKDVAETAFRALTEWPEMSAAPKLLDLAKTSQDVKQSVLATRGLIRLAGLREEPEDKRLQAYRDALSVAKRPDEKKQAFAGLVDLLSFESLTLLQGQFTDQALAGDAAQAAVRLCRSLAAIDTDRVVKALEAIKGLNGVPDNVKNEAEQALQYVKGMGNTEGFIAAWMISGPFEKEGKDGGALFDVAFEPEKKDGKAAWQLYVSDIKQGARIIPLDKIYGGENRVAYLKAILKSDNEQEVLFEAGSDDGIKVWLNGQQIHANNAARPVEPGQDKFKAKLKQGDNELLCKVTQGGGGWGVVLRIRSAGGGDAQGVSVRPK
jgi:hypothetical protein